MNKKINRKTVLALLIGMSIANFVFGQNDKIFSENNNKNEVAVMHPSSHETEIRTLVSSQDAEGITQTQMNLDFLKNIEAYTVERATVKAKEYLQKAGYPDASVHYASEATYVESGSIKLGIIRASSKGVRQIVVFGIVGSEFKRVLCYRKSEEAIPVSYGACAEKIKDVYGVSLGP